MWRTQNSCTVFWLAPFLHGGETSIANVQSVIHDLTSLVNEYRRLVIRYFFYQTSAFRIDSTRVAQSITHCNIVGIRITLIVRGPFIHLRFVSLTLYIWRICLFARFFSVFSIPLRSRQAKAPKWSKPWARQSYKNAGTTGRSVRWRVWAATCITFWPHWTGCTTSCRWAKTRYFI